MTWLRAMGQRLPRILRGGAWLILLLAALAGAALIVLAQADLYSLRDRYEQSRLALFGPWQPQNWCPPGRKSESCGTDPGFLGALYDARDLTFFQSFPLNDTGVEIQIGTRFATARDVVIQQPAYQWCYLSLPHHGAQRQIELATKSAYSPPDYADLSGLNDSLFADTELSVTLLRFLARSHCDFDAATQRKG